MRNPLAGCIVALLAFIALIVRLLVRPTGSGPSGGATASGATYSANNDVRYLIDGVDYFAQVKADLAAVAATPDSYAHMRYWWCDEFAPLDLARTETFYQAVKAMSDHGREVRILLWEPTGMGATAFAKVKSDNDKTRDALNHLPHVIVRTIERAGALGKNSYHEKTTMIKTDGVTVTAGGLNMAESYLDEWPHDAPQPRSNWHDVAIRVVGPATDDVESDFRKDWEDSKPQPAPALMPKIIGQPVAAGDDVYIGSSKLDPDGIKNELLYQVDHAHQCIYIENYSVHHPELINRIARRIEASGRLLEVIIVLPPPTKQNDGIVYAWLHYVTYVELSLARCKEFHYRDGANVKIARRGAPDWTFERKGDYYEDSQVRLGTGIFAKTIPIKDLISFNEDVPLYKAFSVDVNGNLRDIYVHSKVAVFDEKCAVVGSANFAPRSLDAGRDGELSVFVKGPSVPAFRNALWAHWFKANPPTSAGAFLAAVANNVSALKAGKLARHECFILPIDDADWQKTKPDFSSVQVKTALGSAGSILGPFVTGLASLTGLDSADLW